MKTDFTRLISLASLVSILLAACGGAVSQIDAPNAPTESTALPAPTQAPTKEPSSTPAPNFTQILIDGNASDWAQYPVNMTDKTSDQLAGAADLAQVKYFINDKTLYILIIFLEPGNWDDMALGLGYNDGSFNQLNIRPNSYVTIGGETTTDLQAETVVTDTVVEFKVSLDQIRTRTTRLVDILYIDIYFHAENGNDKVDYLNDRDGRLALTEVDELEPITSSTRVNFTTSGSIRNNETWTGEITLTGDVFIENNATLTIEPGTIVYLTPDSDDQACCDWIVESWNGNNEIAVQTVEGKLIAVGTEEQPIIFVPLGIDLDVAGLVGERGNNPNSGQWHGLLIGHDSQVCNADLYYAAFGVVINEQDYQPSRVMTTICNLNIVSPLFDGISATNVDLFAHHNWIENVSGFGIRMHGEGALTAQYNVIIAARNGIRVGANNEAVIQNNIFIDNQRGVELDTNLTVDVLNNTFVMEESLPEDWHYEDDVISQTVGANCAIAMFGLGILTAINNIIFGIFDCSFELTSDLDDESVISHNQVDGPHDAATPVPNMPDSKLAGDPLFADPANGDYTLLPTSPAIDAGAPDTFDADGSPADLGAFGGEFGGGW